MLLWDGACHVPTGIQFVSNQSVQEARNSIDNGHQSHYYTETGFGDAKLCTQSGNGKGEVLANKIEKRITNHRCDDYTILPMKKLSTYFHDDLYFPKSTFSKDISKPFIKFSATLCNIENGESTTDLKSTNYTVAKLLLCDVNFFR